jgi:hypothetical protein
VVPELHSELLSGRPASFAGIDVDCRTNFFRINPIAAHLLSAPLPSNRRDFARATGCSGDPHSYFVMNAGKNSRSLTSLFTAPE